MCVGTEERRSGTRARWTSRAACTGDTTVGNGLASSATVPDGTKVGPGVPDSRCSDTAQQPSACDWLTICVALEEWDAEWCTGQVSSSAQQAIRASGVAAQPAHTARFPPQSARTVANDARRLARVSTRLEWRTGAPVSNRPTGCPRPAASAQTDGSAAGTN